LGTSGSHLATWERSGGLGSGLAWANSSQDPIWKIPNTQGGKEVVRKSNGVELTKVCSQRGYVSNPFEH
jgi:hypothetical protein